jgi:hypothetical protein
MAVPTSIPHTHRLEPITQILLATRTHSGHSPIGSLFLRKMNLNKRLERVAMPTLICRARTNRRQLDGLVGGDFIRIRVGR